MHPIIVFSWMSVLFLAPVIAVDAQMQASLHTKQTTIALAAAEQEPSVVSLQGEGSSPWVNSAAEALPALVEVKGQTVALHWKLDRDASRIERQKVSFVYVSSSPRLRLTWEWEARAEIGPIEHSIKIENLDSGEIWLPLQDSLRFKFNVDPGQAIQHLYVEKGMGRPTDIGTHEAAIAAGYHWEGSSSTYAKNDEPREVIPWFMIQRENQTRDGWFVGIEFSGRTHLTLSREANAVQGSVGLNPNPGPYRTRLSAGETFEVPTILLGAFSGGRDGLGNVLRPWVRQVLNSPVIWKNPQYPMLVNNSWGSGMQVDEGLALRMIKDSAELGLEMFHIDAGWFRGVGDWYPSPTKFPHGLAPIAEEAHQKGLKFGIWVDWAQAGVDTFPGALNAHDEKIRDWLVADVPPDWKPDDFVGRTMDLGQPVVKAYAQQEVERIVSDYHLDMLEHDGYLVAKNCSRTDHVHAAAVPAQMSTVKGNGIGMPNASNSTDVSYHAVRAYYDIYSHIRQKHPELMFEVCNDGGRMVDFGSASHADYFSITDTYDPLSNRRAFYDTSHMFPVAMMEDYVEKWPTPRIENFRYMLRSGMMGWLTIMQDTNAWSPEQHAAAKAEFALYKSDLRPLIRDADLYHVSSRPDGVHWDAIELFDPARGRGVVYAFRGSTPTESKHAFPLQGVRPDRQYRLHFQDQSSSDHSVSGSVLLKTGLSVSLPVPQSSELIFLQESGN